MYMTKWFKLSELVSPKLLEEVPQNVLWEMFDDRLLQAADIIRQQEGPIYVNSPARGLTDCGLRDRNDTNYLPYEPHKFGRALDLHIVSYRNPGQYNELRQALLRDEFLFYVNFEMDINWLHIDTYNRPKRTFKG